MKGQRSSRRLGRLRPAALVVAAIALLCALSSCGPRLARRDGAGPLTETALRILLTDSAPELRLDRQPLRASVPSLGEVEFPNGILAVPGTSSVLLVDPITGVEKSGGAEALLSPADGGLIEVGGRPYRGAIAVRVNPAGGLSIINVVNLEAYVAGVVPGEIGRQPALRSGAVEAQAIAARTYALSSLGQYGAAGYDLVATVQDQVYGGAVVEDSGTTRAVESTAGLVLAHAGELARAYYSSTCGGRTAAVEEAWPGRAGAPYLRGVSDRSLRRGAGMIFCEAAPDFAWTEEWGAAELNEILSRTISEALGLPAGEDVGKLTTIRVSERGKSGRVLALELGTTRGRYVVERDMIRRVLRRPGSRDAILRSSLFRIERVDRDAGRVSRLVISGRGNGHGVGMCQTGALAMAEIGVSGEEILEHYYPGARVRPIDGLPAVSALFEAREIAERMLRWTLPLAAVSRTTRRG